MFLPNGVVKMLSKPPGSANFPSETYCYSVNHRIWYVIECRSYKTNVTFQLFHPQDTVPKEYLLQALLLT